MLVVGAGQIVNCITIKGSIFLAEGEYEVRRQGLGLAGVVFGMPGLPPASPETDRYRVKYSGQIYGHTIKSNVTREEIRKPPSPSSLLSLMKDETPALMIASDDLSEIRVYEKRASKGPLFYTLIRLG